MNINMGTVYMLHAHAPESYTQHCAYHWNESFQLKNRRERKQTTKLEKMKSKCTTATTKKEEKKND